FSRRKRIRSSRRMRRCPPGVLKTWIRPASAHLRMVSAVTWQYFATSEVLKDCLVSIAWGAHPVLRAFREFFYGINDKTLLESFSTFFHKKEGTPLRACWCIGVPRKTGA